MMTIFSHLPAVLVASGRPSVNPMSLARVRRAGGEFLALIAGKAPVVAAFVVVAIAVALASDDARAQTETPTPVSADSENTASSPGRDEPTGTWRFQSERPVKLIVAGGSVAAYYGGNFGDYLEGVCQNVEVENVAKARYGAWAIYKRVIAQVFNNRRVRAAADPDDPTRGTEWWIAVHGGLNSIATPSKTNHWIRKLILRAHEENFRVLGLTLTPWGDSDDKRRWAGASGLHYRRFTQQAVDFLLGKLSPDEALESYASDREPGPWTAAEKPDLAVDLYDSALRDAGAEPYPADKLARAVRADRRLRREVEALPEAEQEAAWAALVEEAASVPRWFMREELRAFDHIHPNTEGHRLMALAACPALPASWGCDCDALKTIDLKAQK